MTPAEYRTRCRMAESCLPPAEYRTLLTQLHDDMLGVIEAATDFEAVAADQAMTIAMDKTLMQQALEALETGRDYAYEAAEQFHVEMRGYKQQRHEAMDADVKQLDNVIAALQERLK